MSIVYNSFVKRLTDGDIDWLNDTIKVALVSDNTSYSPDIDNEEFVSDVLDGGTTAEEFAGTGYSRQVVQNKTNNIDAANDDTELDGDNVVFSGIDSDIVQSALVYKQVGGDDSTPGDDPLIMHVTSADFPYTASGGDLEIQWDADGLTKLSVI